MRTNIIVPDFEKEYINYGEECIKNKAKPMNRLYYGMYRLENLVRVREQRLITKSEYNQCRRALEKFMGL